VGAVPSVDACRAAVACGHMAKAAAEVRSWRREGRTPRDYTAVRGRA